MPTVNELLVIAKAELENILQGEVLLVRDLFKVFEWKRIFDYFLALFLNYIY